MFARGPYFDFEMKQRYVLQVQVWDDGMVYGWTNTSGLAALQQKKVPNVYAKASITVNIINMNESPVCPHMVGAQSYSVVENSARGTVLNSNLGKYQAASADYLSDDGDLFIFISNHSCNNKGSLD